MKPLLVALLMCISITSCFAGSSPSVTAQVSTASGMTTYVYTVTNDLDTAATIGTLCVFMPEPAARAVISFTCPGVPLWNIYSFRGDFSMRGVVVDIAPGASRTCILTTPATLPTSYTFKPPMWLSNWGWNSSHTNMGNSLLPVPVPEPSSLLALAGGIAGLGGLALRRKRR